MCTSKDVFALRKAGQLDEAYKLALSLNDVPEPDIWDIRALGWCLVDLVNKAISQGDYQILRTYKEHLDKIDVDPDERRYNALTPSEDGPLIARRNRALSLIRQAESQQRNGNSGQIVTYKDIFAKRKDNLDQAYAMALQATAGNDSCQMELNALAWCLIDLIKRDFRAGNYNNLESYRHKLQSIAVDTDQNNVLADQKAYALSMCEPNAAIFFQAQKFSKQEQYLEALNCYRKLFPNIPQKYHMSFGWALYKYSMQIVKQGQHTIPQIKIFLQQYLQLDIEKPSLLHSAILRLAKSIAKLDKLDLAAFLRIWGIKNFRHEDFKREMSDDGRQFPALAEDAFQRSVKSAVKSKNIAQVEYLVPFFDDFIKRYSDNEWLVYYKAKALVLLGRNNEAQKYCLSVCKRKPREFWTWSLLGDSYDEYRQAALACYAKALLCPAEEDKTFNLRLKAAQCLAELGYKEQAKLELSICHRLKPDFLPEEATRLMSQDWFQETEASSSNADFYAEHAKRAEELLLADIPWVEAVAGDVFTIPANENREKQTRRRVYLKAEPFPREVSCPVKQFPFPVLLPGSPIHVKGEEIQGRPYKILAVSQRISDKLWDIFSSRIGIISFVNKPKKTYHILIQKNIECFIHFDKINFQLDEYDFVRAKIAVFIDDKCKKYTAIDVTKTIEKPNDDIYMEFSDEEVTISGDVGFTDSDIYIPPNLVKNFSLTNHDNVSGKAILSYNRKRGTWGWKAIEIVPYVWNGECDSGPYSSGKEEHGG